MGIAIVANDDPNAAVGQVIVLTVAAVVFAALGIGFYRPLFSVDRASNATALGARI